MAKDRVEKARKMGRTKTKNQQQKKENNNKQDRAVSLIASNIKYPFG